MKLLLVFFIALSFYSPSIFAKQVYRQPVHLDDSGKPVSSSWQKHQIVHVDDSGQPIVNSWQKNEDLRQQNKKDSLVVQCKLPANGQGPCVSKDKKSSGVKPAAATPSSVIINRPVNTSGDTSSKKFGF